MLYMVIEQFKDAPAIYRRFREKGRMIPDGLSYISSWIDTDLKVCYQLMETEDVALFQRWTENWANLMEFQTVPVRTSAETSCMLQLSHTAQESQQKQGVKKGSGTLTE